MVFIRASVLKGWENKATGQVGRPRLVINSVQLLSEVARNTPKKVIVTVDVADIDVDFIASLRQVLQGSDGYCPVEVRVEDRATGLALSMHNVFTFEQADRIQITSVDATHVPGGPNNLVYRSARAVFDQLGVPLKGLRITQRNDIPMARGLGSSSACIVAGLLGANALLGCPLTQRQMLTLATAIEGHPDNVAPAMLGGFVTSVYDEGLVYTVKKNIDPDLAFAAFVPDFHLLTSKAREALP